MEGSHLWRFSVWGSGSGIGTRADGNCNHCALQYQLVNIMSSFWKTYLTSYDLFAVKAVVLFIVSLLMYYFIKNDGSVVAFVIGVIASDPFTYWIVNKKL